MASTPSAKQPAAEAKAASGTRLVRPESAPELRRFQRGLLLLLVLAGAFQLLIAAESFSENPMVLVPQVDAAVVWSHAGEIAGGALVDEAPFETAPLMLWWAALIRAMGGGLGALAASQVLLYLVTLVLIGRLSRRLAASVGSLRFATWVGWLGAGLFLALDEPAAATSRVLAGSLQLALTAGLLDMLTGIESRAGRSASPRRAALVGALTGLCCLAFPPYLALLPLVPLWLFGSGVGGQRAALIAVAVSLVTIAPATLHNQRASGEFIPISSQAGLTFYHGNNPAADGTLAAVGVVNSKEEQALDSLLKARAALGDEGAGWNDASRYWLGQGLEWWQQEPGRALSVAGLKLWYTLTGRRYGDVYQPWMERRDGVATRLWLAPLTLAWILPAGLWALLALARRRGLRSAGPYLLIVAVPLAVCVVFWYTPRYRLPASAGLLPLAALALGLVVRDRARAWPALVAVAAGALFTGINAEVGFDQHESHERRHAARMAAAFGRLERHDQGLRFLRQDLTLAPEDAEATSRVVMLLLMLGRDAEAMDTLSAAPGSVRGLPGPRTLLAWTRATSADPAARDGVEALSLAEALVEELGADPERLDVRAAARARAGDFDGAADDAAQAASALTAADPLRTEIEARLELYRSGSPYTQPMTPQR
jgi:hypothetical protein